MKFPASALLVLLLVPVKSALCQESRWDQLMKRSPGRKIELVDGQAGTLQGQLVSIDEQGLTLRRKEGVSKTVARAETPQAAKIKAKVQKRGTGEKSPVKVTLANGAEIKGCVSKIEESSFTVTDKKTGQISTIPYADVEKIRGPGLSKGGKIALVVVGVAVVALVAIGVAVGHAD